MPRPCTCERPACPLCTRYHTSPRHRAAWDAAPAAAAAVTPAARPRCGHRDEEPIGGAKASALGLSPLRDWHRCALGHGLKSHVCGCKAWPDGGCSGCPDYTAGAADGR